MSSTTLCWGHERVNHKHIATAMLLLWQWLCVLLTCYIPILGSQGRRAYRNLPSLPLLQTELTPPLLVCPLVCEGSIPVICLPSIQSGFGTDRGAAKVWWGADSLTGPHWSTYTKLKSVVISSTSHLHQTRMHQCSSSVLSLPLARCWTKEEGHR